MTYEEEWEVKKARATEWVEELISQMYYKGDEDQIENCLEEVAYYFDLQIPKTDMIIRGKDNESR